MDSRIARGINPGPPAQRRYFQSTVLRKAGDAGPLIAIRGFGHRVFRKGLMGLRDFGRPAQICQADHIKTRRK